MYLFQLTSLLICHSSHPARFLLKEELKSTWSWQNSWTETSLDLGLLRQQFNSPNPLSYWTSLTCQAHLSAQKVLLQVRVRAKLQEHTHGAITWDSGELKCEASGFLHIMGAKINIHYCGTNHVNIIKLVTQIKPICTGKRTAGSQVTLKSGEIWR